MKHSSKTILVSTVLALLMTACGGTSYQKEPVSDLPEMREQGKSQMDNKDSQVETDAANEKNIETLKRQLATVIRERDEERAKSQGSYDQNSKKYEQQIKDLSAKLQEAYKVIEAKPTEPTKVVVHDEKEVKTESATITGDYFIISPESQIMTFTEGESSSYKIRARATVPGVKIKLTASGLPQGATLTSAGDASQADLYVLTYKPELYTVAVNDADRMEQRKATLKIEIVSSEKLDKATLQGIVRDQEVLLNIVRNVAAPTNVTVENLPETIKEGSQVSFSVVATIPGIDGKAPTKPNLDITGDNYRKIPGKNYVEQSGYPLVSQDLNHRDAEYLGNSQWRFFRILDAKNTPIALEKAADGSVVKDSSSTHYNLVITVRSPFSTTSAPVTKQFQVARNVEKAVDAPRFNLSGVNGQAIELTPGETVRLNFSASTLDASGEVKVEIGSLSGLAGAPVASCQVSSKGKFEQECSIQWTVPCDVQDKDLSQTVSMSAYAIQDGRNSQVSKQDLKSIRSKKAAGANCAQEKKK